MDLDIRVAQALMAARLMERALHDEGPWSVSWNGQNSPAERLVTRDGIVFAATFVGPLTGGTAVLRCGADPVRVCPVECEPVPDGAWFTLEWALSAAAVAA